ncbi:hypothetical protein [Actinomadura spongiicola]|nr:hypothetical protein [Actinomadura spongiicola]
MVKDVQAAELICGFPLTVAGSRERFELPVIRGRIVEGAMALVCIGIDPETNEDKCPAVFVDTDTGDFVLVGWTVTDPETLAGVAEHTPVADYETVVRLPARMREIVLQALEVPDVGERPELR